MNTRLLTCLLLAATCPLDARAAALGELQVASYLGQRLSATIPLEGDTRLGPDCFTPVKPAGDTHADLPWVRHFSVNLHKEGGRGRLIVTTAKPLDEPMLALGLKVGCGVDLVREYVLMLSPPPHVRTPVAVVADPGAPDPAPVRERPRRSPPRQEARAGTHTWIIGVGESVHSLATSLYPDNPSMQKSFARAVFRANPDLAIEYSSRDQLPRGMALEIPDLRALANSSEAAEAVARPERKPGPEPAPGSQLAAGPEARLPAKGDAKAGGKSPADEPAPSGDRLVISPAPGPEFYPGDAVFQARLAETRSELEQLSRHVGSQLPRGEGQQDARVLALESRLAAVQQALERMQAEEAALQLAEAAARAEPAAAPAPVPTPLPEAVAPASPPPPSHPVLVAREARPAAGGYWEVLVLGGGMGLAGIGLGAWLGYRNRRQKPDWMLDLERTSGAGLMERGRRIMPAPVMKSVFRPREPGDGLESGNDLPLVHELSSVANPLEYTDLTDFMLATGRVESAAEFLRDFVEAEPDKALTPWIKLLTSYRKLGKQREFRWVARQLRLHFNVAEIRWGDNLENIARSLESEAPHLGNARPGGIEAMPHVCNMVMGLWGTPACYKYLESLLRDNRDGQRQGFSLPVIQDILFLMQLLQQEEYAEKRLL